jgi:hypothetical protein
MSDSIVPDPWRIPDPASKRQRQSLHVMIGWLANHHGPLVKLLERDDAQEAIPLAIALVGILKKYADEENTQTLSNVH